MGRMNPARSTYWQEAWSRAGIARGRHVPGHGKYFALVAYPGPSGFLHVGHLRGYAYGDPLHRYHRMLGEEVLFPFGIHASGLPAVAWARKVADRDPTVVAQLEEHGVPPSEWATLGDPERAARFLGREYLRVLRRMGVLIDESTYLTTADEDYQAFVRWQFGALRQTNSLAQGAYFASVCPVCGPVAVDAAETDLSEGGDAEELLYTTVPFRLDDGRQLLAATLRPETVYGVTNVWVPPDGELVVWHLGPEQFLVARTGGERLVEQHGGRLGHPVPVAEIVGRTVTVPLRDARVPVLGSPLVDVKLGTGVVMSVPAHAPADAAALHDLSSAQRATVGTPIELLELPAQSKLGAHETALLAGEGTPAERALRAVHAKGLADRSAVEQATERLYRLEFARGTMTVAELAGVPVREARTLVATRLHERGGSFELREFSKPVVCRNGHEVVIRRVVDQWFLRYGDPEWKARTKAIAARVAVVPDDYARELPGIIDWYADRPCARKGPWLGTPLPFDPAWTIEPIADSTMYMAYFVVRRFVADGRVPLNALTPAFFDYVFRGAGAGEPTVDRRVQDEVRSEFLYWYPLDVNIGGKEHKRVHFPVFLYTHARLLDDPLQPLGILEHGWITTEAGAKISKKDVAIKGLIPPIDAALARWGPDPIRLGYVLTVSVGQDVEWSDEAVEATAGRIAEVERLLKEALGDGDGPPELDAWLSSRVHGLLLRYHAGFRSMDLRSAAEIAFSEIPSVLRRYYARGGVAGSATDRLARAWVRLIAPFTPHVAEEMGAGWFDGLVAVQRMPQPDEFPRVPVAEAREAYLDRVEDDLRSVLRPALDRGEPVPDAAVFFVAAPWKTPVEQWLREGMERGAIPSIKDVMTRAQGHPEVAAHRAVLPKYVERVAQALRSEPRVDVPAIEEAETLRAAEGYLVRRFGFRAVTVLPEDAAANDDPLGRRDRARPGRPAFYLTRPGEPRPE
jgi:leucyl-tRNA synthetase